MEQKLKKMFAGFISILMKIDLKRYIYNNFENKFLILCDFLTLTCHPCQTPCKDY